MAGPGGDQAPPAPVMPKGMMTGMLMMLAVMMVVMLFRDQIGFALNFVFYPLIGFGGSVPVVTLMIAGAVMIGLSTVIRTFMSDPVEQARNQQYQSEFNKELRQARIENNMYKMKKLTDQQPEMMARSMKQSSDMMKVMPITMAIIMPLYAWVNYFLVHGEAMLTTVNIPWGTVDLLQSTALPHWILIYTLISIPLGQLIGRMVKYYMFRKRLKEIEGSEFS
ncbi:MAG: EMC3/TMCO1 family protein [Candidatus Methanomethylophilaceae archaeon]|jgi:uncharacterized membrane protein (DUF106 family)|nr:EMC3/TMCO1 family protein [Candidatus Methanomethylophilaceae archaeon]